MSDNLSQSGEDNMDIDYVNSPSSPSLFEYICPCLVSQNHKYIQNGKFYYFSTYNFSFKALIFSYRHLL